MEWQHWSAAPGRRLSSLHVCWPISSGGVPIITDVASPCLAAGGARAAARTRGQSFGATLPTAYADNGSRENRPPVDGLRAALVPVAKGVRLSRIEAGWGAVSCRGEMRRVLAEALGGSRARGRAGRSGLPHHKNRPEGGLQKPDRILHHVQWQHRWPLAATFRLRAPKPVTGAGSCRGESAERTHRSTRMEPR